MPLSKLPIPTFSLPPKGVLLLTKSSGFELVPHHSSTFDFPFRLRLTWHESERTLQWSQFHALGKSLVSFIKTSA